MFSVDLIAKVLIIKTFLGIEEERERERESVSEDEKSFQVFWGRFCAGKLWNENVSGSMDWLMAWSSILVKVHSISNLSDIKTPAFFLKRKTLLLLSHRNFLPPKLSPTMNYNLNSINFIQLKLTFWVLEAVKMYRLYVVDKRWYFSAGFCLLCLLNFIAGLWRTDWGC